MYTRNPILPTLPLSEKSLYSYMVYCILQVWILTWSIRVTRCKLRDNPCISQSLVIEPMDKLNTWRMHVYSIQCAYILHVPVRYHYNIHINMLHVHACTSKSLLLATDWCVDINYQRELGNRNCTSQDSSLPDIRHHIYSRFSWPRTVRDVEREAPVWRD